jgi:hypothetical protein
VLTAPSLMMVFMPSSMSPPTSQVSRPLLVQSTTSLSLKLQQLDVLPFSPHVKAPWSLVDSAHCAGILFMLRRLNAPSIAATPLNAQHEPHWPYGRAIVRAAEHLAHEPGSTTNLVFDAGNDVLVDPVELGGGGWGILSTVRAKGGGLARGHGAQHAELVLAVAEVGKAVHRKEKSLFASEIRGVVGVDLDYVGLPVGQVMCTKCCRGVGLAVQHGPRVKSGRAAVVVGEGLGGSKHGGCGKGNEQQAEQRFHGEWRKLRGFERAGGVEKRAARGAAVKRRVETALRSTRRHRIIAGKRFKI